MACIVSPMQKNYSRVEGLCEQRYVRMPRVEELLVSFLSPCSASSLKAPTLPMGVERARSALKGAKCTHCDVLVTVR